MSKTKNETPLDLESIVNQFSGKTEETMEDADPSIASEEIETANEVPKETVIAAQKERVSEEPTSDEPVASKECRDNMKEEHRGRLWNEFISCLQDNDDTEDDEEAAGKNRRYAIDDDIVETLHECNFGKSNTNVINSILRTFLVDNLANLREIYRPKRKSLFDKYRVEDE